MKILFLCKRHPQGRDLLERPYGRFFYLPQLLSESGHDVHLALLSHKGLRSEVRNHAGLSWSSDDLKPWGPGRYYTRLCALIPRLKPDWIVGFSDTYYGILATHLGNKFRIKVAIDAYDNFESYIPWARPIHWTWRRALSRADLVTAAGPQLADLLRRYRRSEHRTGILPMAADPRFTSMDRTDSRRLLELPENAPLIGYTGGWASNRGTHMLLNCFRRVQTVYPDSKLVLSGSPPAEVAHAAGVIALGYLEDHQLPTLLNALDVSCVLTADNEFGRYSYPAKLCEAMACGTPIVATATGPVRWMLGGREEFLADVGDADSIAARIMANLKMARADYGILPSWHDSARQLETMLAS